MNAPAKIEASLHSAMAAAFGEVEAATKSANNSHFKSKYADIGAVIDAIKPALIRHGLFFTQHPEPSERGVCVETVLHHAGGESMSMGKLFVPANKQDAQGFGSALTYARRYALVTAFGVPTEDDDGNAAARAGQGHSDERAVSPAPAKRENWGGTYPNKTALHRGLTTHQRDLEGCGDLDMLDALTGTKDWQAFVETAEQHAPHYLYGGDPAPPEFEGLLVQAKRLRDKFNLETANHMADLAHT